MEVRSTVMVMPSMPCRYGFSGLLRACAMGAVYRVGNVLVVEGMEVRGVVVVVA